MKRVLLFIKRNADCKKANAFFHSELRGLQKTPFLKTLFSLCLSIFYFAGSVKAQVPITYYDFDNNTTRSTGELTVEQEVNAGTSTALTKAGSVSSAISYNNGAASYNGGTATGKAASATDWSTSSTSPGAGATKYFQLTTSSAGFGGMKVALEGQTYSGGPTYLGISYSTDGVNFTASTTTPLTIPTSWQALMFFDLPAGANNAPSLTIRVFAYGASSSAGRLDIDNIVVMAATQTAGVKTLLNYTALGNSLVANSGTPVMYPWQNFTITGSGTETILASDTRIWGTLTVNSGATLTCGAYNVLDGQNYGLGAGTFVLNAGGTLRIGSASGISSSGATGNIQLGTRTYSVAANYEYSGTVAQVIGSGFPTNLTGSLIINNTGTTYKTVTLDVVRTIASGGTLNLQNGTFASGTNLTMASGSLITRSGADMSGTPVNNAQVTYTGNSKTPSSELSASLGILIVNLTSGQTLTLSSALTVTSSLTLSGGTLNIGANTLTLSGTIARNGTTQTGTITAVAANLVLNGASAQTIPSGVFSGTFNNVTVNNSLGVTLASDLTASGTLSLTAGTFTVNGGILTIKGSITRTAGAINAAAGTIVFNGSIAQTIAASVFSSNINNLTINNTAGVTTSASLTINTALDLTAGTFSIGTTTLTVNGNITSPAGTISASSGTIVLSGSSAQSIAASSFTGAINNLTVNNSAGVTTSSDLSVTTALTLTAGTFTLSASTLTLSGTVSRTSGAIDASAGTVVYAGSSAQTMAASVFSGAINNLTINNTAGVTTAVSQTISNNLTLTAGTLALGSTTLTVKGNIVRTSGLLSAASASLQFSGSALQTIDAGVFSGSINNLTINNTAGVTSAADATISGTLTLTAGTYNIGTSTHTITGSISAAAGLMDASSGTLVFNGSTAQTIPANSVATSIKNMTLNNAAGLTINANHMISAVLNLQGGSLSLNGKTVTLGGTVTGTGNFKGSSTSGLAVAASGAVGTLNFDQTTDGTTNALSSLAVSSGSATLGGKMALYSVLNVSAGTLDLASKSVVLKSLSTNTARVAPVTGTINNATNVTVERWFPNDGRKYRFVTPGVTTTTSIKANWMEGGMNTSFCSGCNVNPNPGYGTQITGNGGNSNGFDVTTSNSASLYMFNQTNTSWTAVTSTAGTLSATTPYLIFLRGDRSVDMTASGSVPVLLPGSGTTLRATGTLPIGTKTINGLAAAGKTSLVSNPYPSPISWSTIYSNNSASFENYYTYFEPKIGQRGAYVTVTNSGLANNVNSTATDQIQSGQAFLVTTKTGVTSPSITIREQDKATTSNINVFRAAKQMGAIEKFYISLNFKVTNGDKYNADGVLVAYGQDFSNDVDENDAVQSANMDEDIAIVRMGKSLSIETRQALVLNDSVQLSMARMKIGTDYEWQFTPQEMASYPFGGYLLDRFLNTKSPISLTDTTFLPFTVTSNTASVASDRFVVVFNNVPGTILPVTFTSVQAYANANSSLIQVDWKTANESSLSVYEVEKSTDGQSFKKLGSVKPKGGASNVYGLVDSTVISGKNYYRIKSIDLDGKATYSNTVLVRTGDAKSAAAILYPNPVHGSTINLQFNNTAKGTYTVQVWNSAGALLYSSKIEWSGGNGSQTFDLPPTLSAGVYNLNLQGGSTEFKLIFIKG